VSIHLSVPGSALPGRFNQRPLAENPSARWMRTDAKRAVCISAAAQQLSGLQSGDADIHLERVNALRAAIASGTLTIDTSRIADGLIQSACELLGEEPSRGDPVR